MSTEVELIPLTFRRGFVYWLFEDDNLSEIRRLLWTIKRMITSIKNSPRSLGWTQSIEFCDCKLENFWICRNHYFRIFYSSDNFSLSFLPRMRISPWIVSVASMYSYLRSCVIFHFNSSSCTSSIRKSADSGFCLYMCICVCHVWRDVSFYFIISTYVFYLKNRYLKHCTGQVDENDNKGRCFVCWNEIRLYEEQPREDAFVFLFSRFSSPRTKIKAKRG